jgi:hypothetical protein
MKMKLQRIKQVLKGAIESVKYHMIYEHLYEDHRDILSENAYLKTQTEELKRLYERMDAKCAILEPRGKILVKINKQLIDLIDMDNKRLYHFLERYDINHSCLHSAVYDLINIDICGYFYAEDCLGYFEGDDYGTRIKYLEAAQFAKITYKYEGSYELVESINLDYKNDKYKEFETKKFSKAIEYLLDLNSNEKAISI